jgi:hypothetical protein
VQLVTAEDAPSVVPDSTALVVVGGPTEAHRMTEPLARLFDRIPKGGLSGKAAAAFDTRLRAPAWLSGSAGSGIERRLRLAGARVISPEVSFFVSGKMPVLEPGEVERAAGWAKGLAVELGSKEPAPAAS